MSMAYWLLWITCDIGLSATLLDNDLLHYPPSTEMKIALWRRCTQLELDTDFSINSCTFNVVFDKCVPFTSSVCGIYKVRR